jgi:L-fucose isomerase-like protein
MSGMPMIIENIPQVRLGMIAVSRDCFPMELSRKRRDLVIEKLAEQNQNILAAGTVVENELDAVKAISELEEMGANALVVYLGNFGPEGPETLLAKLFAGPVMYAAAAEETQENLISSRG